VLLRLRNPPEEWRRDFLLLGKTAMLAGAGGSAKTTTVCSLAMSVATGRAWLGEFEVAEPGHVLLVLGEEDADEIKRRMRGVSQCLELSEEERTHAYERIHVLPAYGTDVRLSDDLGNPMAIVDCLESYLALNEIQWRLIVLDPASRFMNAAAELDAAAATRYVELLECLTRAPGGPGVLTTHHVSKGSMRSAEKDQGAPRGSSALVDGVRWMALVDKPVLKADVASDLRTAGFSPGTLVRLTLQKTNYTPPLDTPFYFRLARGGMLVPLSSDELKAVEVALGGRGNRDVKKGRQKGSLRNGGLFDRLA